MKSRYIIRLDDASYNSKISKWKRIESILSSYDIKPIVAVIPKNKDLNISFSEKNPSFWKIVKRWQDMNWCIGMHGYEHVLHKIKRNQSIFPFHERSEFSGLPKKIQKNKIKESLKIFERNKIYPMVWVAPAHTFDKNTISVIKEITQIKIVSDGIALDSYSQDDLSFLPQQLWSYKKRPFGLWTICLHPDNMDSNQFEELEKSILSNRKKFISIDEVIFKEKTKNLFDKLYSFFFWRKYLIKELIKRLISK